MITSTDCLSSDVVLVLFPQCEAFYQLWIIRRLITSSSSAAGSGCRTGGVPRRCPSSALLCGTEPGRGPGGPGRSRWCSGSPPGSPSAGSRQKNEPEKQMKSLISYLSWPCACSWLSGGHVELLTAPYVRPCALMQRYRPLFTPLIPTTPCFIANTFSQPGGDGGRFGFRYLKHFNIQLALKYKKMNIQNIYNTFISTFKVHFKLFCEYIVFLYIYRHINTPKWLFLLTWSHVIVSGLTVLGRFVDASHGAVGQNLEMVANPDAAVEQLLFDSFSDWMRTWTCCRKTC